MKKAQIGKGIAALLDGFDESPVTKRRQVVQELNAKAYRIPVDQIEANPFQPRSHFDDDALQELAASIRSLDVIQPLTVRRVSDGRYQLISGERRWRASKLAGLTDVPAYVRTADDQGMLEMAIVENVQRADLNPIETSIAYQRLIDEVGLTHDQLSTRLGKQRSTITNSLRLLKLPAEVQDSLRNKRISAGHGRALAGLNDHALQVALLRTIEREGLSVRQTEVQVKRVTHPEANTKQIAQGASLSPVLADIQRELSTNYGSRVQLKREPSGKGQIVLHFKSDDEFNRLLDQLRGE